MTVQKYALAVLVTLFTAGNSMAQCLSHADAFEQKLEAAEKILEGRVVGQTSFFGDDGNIYTSNQIEVYRVFQGDVGFDANIITEGGIVGDLMQIVTPSVKFEIGDYGVFSVSDEKTTAFIPIDELTGIVHSNHRFEYREALYENIARYTGTNAIELRRVPLSAFEPSFSREGATPEVQAIFPSEVTAGTRTIMTIVGVGFGETQGTGYVAFSNADDGGQSFVALQPGPHYLSWSDTEIQLYVPSATLYNNTVAGSGIVRVINADGEQGVSQQQVAVKYAKSEVVYNENLNRTMLVGMQEGGYRFTINQQLLSFLGGRDLVESSFVKWACNTGVNFVLDQEVAQTAEWTHDDINLIGLSEPGQLPNYLLGKTITTFSGCGTSNGLQWNLIEVDIVLNREINWYVGEGTPASGQFDMATSILHEIGHAHLLQHNNNPTSPMYFELLSGSSRRDLNMETDIEGGTFIGHEANNAAHVCGESVHEPYDKDCNLSLINSITDEMANELQVYPNPFADELTILLPDFHDVEYTLYDSQGRVVESNPILNTTTSLSTSQLSPGIYLLELNSSEGRQSRRLVKN